MTSKTSKTCCAADHEAMKTDGRWVSLQLIGRQVWEGDAIDPPETLELRNCSCGSTLAKAI